MSLEQAARQALQTMEHMVSYGEWYAPEKVISDLYQALEQPADEPVAIHGNTSDGYHTFNELYEFRKAYNAALFNEWAASGKCSTHKSWRHHDGKLCFGGGWFIVVAVLPSGQISNHYEAKDWDLFAVPETERALFEFDGHTGSDVVARLKAYKTPPVAQLTDEHISAKLDRLLWEYIDLQALYPEHKPDPRTWPHVMAYAPADEPANPPPPDFEWVADGIEIGHDMFGGIDIRLDGEFVYVHINYDYRYTDNATRQRLAEQIVGLLTSPQPAPPAIPEGWKLVPIEPTEAMVEAAWESDAADYVGEHKRICNVGAAYTAMLEVAPSPQEKNHG